MVTLDAYITEELECSALSETDLKRSSSDKHARPAASSVTVVYELTNKKLLDSVTARPKRGFPLFSSKDSDWSVHIPSGKINDLNGRFSKRLVRSILFQ